MIEGAMQTRSKVESGAQHAGVDDNTLELALEEGVHEQVPQNCTSVLTKPR